MHKSLTPTAARGLFEQAPFGYLLIGSDLIIRSANRKAASLLGLSSEQLRQTPMGEFIGSADRQNFETLCGDVVNTGKNRSADLQVRSRNGDMRFVHLHCKPAGAAGQFDEDAGLLVGLIDITERKTSETRLTSERDNLAGILNAMEDGVYIVNNDHEIEYINQALQKQFGPIRNRKCYQYFHNRQSACPWCKNQAVFSGQTVRWDWYSDKTGRTYNLVDTPLKRSDGSILKLEIFRDIR